MRAAPRFFFSVRWHWHFFVECAQRPVFFFWVCVGMALFTSCKQHFRSIFFAFRAAKLVVVLLSTCERESGSESG
jgi:hypothetical protein